MGERGGAVVVVDGGRLAVRLASRRSGVSCWRAFGRRRRAAWMRFGGVHSSEAGGPQWCGLCIMVERRPRNADGSTVAVTHGVRVKTREGR